MSAEQIEAAQMQCDDERVKALRKAHSLIERALPTLAGDALAEQTQNVKAKEEQRRKGQPFHSKQKAQRLHAEAVELMRELSGLK